MAKTALGVNEGGLIVAHVLTERAGDDAATLSRLLEQVEEPVDRFTADGAYDGRPVYEDLEEAGTEDVEVVIPPRSNAVPVAPTGRPGISEGRLSGGFKHLAGQLGRKPQAIASKAESKIPSSDINKSLALLFDPALSNPSNEKP